MWTSDRLRRLRRSVGRRIPRTIRRPGIPSRSSVPGQADPYDGSEGQRCAASNLADNSYNDRRPGPSVGGILRLGRGTGAALCLYAASHPKSLFTRVGTCIALPTAARPKPSLDELHVRCEVRPPRNVGSFHPRHHVRPLVPSRPPRAMSASSSHHVRGASSLDIRK
ncbi:hypothetical protein PHLGIDRAFT_206996 [Phlebiopsis gigantea 11061_1 CR5-6]|uniref:Uncharacterized protein n=1 Tax=Phlebiopsis gigantea (strain 11061_1 CR5-6) TaxID=745531 RepID=A0A0C3PF34_PHLG1|nr:hypothetical protein PHLGIDRAFT_206996 [Phlebiopsis gigantea 11061_1 CR5-6]